MKNRMLVLENGKVFYGEGFGSGETKIAEIVFNTSMVGYQEILTDPAYYGQIVVMSYPMIGNYGMIGEDYEEKNIFLSGFIVREYNDIPSNFRATASLGEVMEDEKVAGLCGPDTRAIVRIIRDEGTMRAMLTDADRNIEECLKELKSAKLSSCPVKEISTHKVWFSRTKNPKFNVVAVDCGIRTNVVRELNSFGCNVVAVPYNASVEDIKRLNPDGIFIPNGPGNPESLPEIVALIRAFKGVVPILGICLGHQLIGLAYGAKVSKLKFGHRGANYPVKDVDTGKIVITTQNNSYTLDEKSLENTGLRLVEKSLFDNVPEKIVDEKNMVTGIQYYPDGTKAEEEGYVFNEFTDMMKKVGGGSGYAKKNRY